jgi:hypothetical protein
MTLRSWTWKSRITKMSSQNRRAGGLIRRRRIYGPSRRSVGLLHHIQLDMPGVLILHNAASFQAHGGRIEGSSFTMMNVMGCLAKLWCPGRINPAGLRRTACSPS